MFVVCEHSSAQLSDREFVREDIVEERGPRTVGKVLVGFPEMRDERLCGDDERTHLQLMSQHRHSGAVRRTDGVRHPFCRGEARGAIAELLINRIAGLQLKFVQCRPDGTFRRVACVSFRERRCLNTANLGPHQDPNAPDNCAIQQVVWHIVIGRHSRPVYAASKVTASSAISVGDEASPLIVRGEVALGMRVWELGPGRFVVAGAFGDLAVHHHPAVQVGVGLRGPLTVTDGDRAPRTCRLVVVASGERHAVRSDERSAALSIYLGPQTWQGVALNAVSLTHTNHGGVWVVESGTKLASATAASMATSGPRAAADFLVGELSKTSNARSNGTPSVHPQLQQAIELVSSRVPGETDLASIARAVALSPDYLGRLCKQQTGASFSATARWVRLLTGLRHIADGMPVTEAAHMAGFADGSHANRVCWELAGAAPSDFARALRDWQLVSQQAV
jgi:AraC-like DNA-binding protein